MRTAFCYALALLLPALAVGAQAEEGGLQPVNLTFSLEAAKRGADVVTSVCMNCHSLKYIRYQDLLSLGYKAEEVDALRGEKDLDAALISDLDPEAAIGTFGKVPPDLSLMAHAREGNGRYIYSMVTGFYLTPDGNVDNHVFPGIKMPDVLGFSSTTDPVQRAFMENQVKDATIFLDWAADPHTHERRTLGFYVLAYLAVLTVLMYFLKQRIWSKLDAPVESAPKSEISA